MATGGLAATLAQEVARVAQLANEYYGIMGRACVQLERNLYYRQLVNTPPEYRISDERIAINVSQMYQISKHMAALDTHLFAFGTNHVGTQTRGLGPYTTDRDIPTLGAGGETAGIWA